MRVQALQVTHHLGLSGGRRSHGRPQEGVVSLRLGDIHLVTVVEEMRGVPSSERVSVGGSQNRHAPPN